MKQFTHFQEIILLIKLYAFEAAFVIVFLAWLVRAVSHELKPLITALRKSKPAGRSSST